MPENSTDAGPGDSPSPVVYQGEPPRVSVKNEAFLRDLFGARWGEVHVTSFDEDPNALDPLGLRHYWGGGLARARLARCLPHQNTYYVVALFAPDPVTGKPNRKKANFIALHVLCVDDVGTKVKAEDVRCRMGEPRWIIETSPGNFQWVYRLKTPITDRAKAEALVNGMIRAGLTQDGKDPGMKGVTRYVRLPVGTNTKVVNRIAPHPQGWPHRAEFMDEPGLDIGVVDAEDVAKAWGFDLGDPTLSGSGTGASGANARPVPASEDPIVAGLGQLGMVRGPLSGGWLEIECPWVHEHTGRADTGAAYLPGAGWKCHHGHCATRTTEEFKSEIVRRLEDEGHGGAGFLARQVFGVIEGVDHDADEAGAKARMGAGGVPALTRPAALSPVVFGQNYASLPRHVRRRILSFLPRAMVTLLAAAPGVGKSMFALMLAFAVATGREDILGLGKIDWRGPMVLLLNEDDRDEVGRRVDAIMRAFGINPADLAHDIIVLSGDTPVVLLARSGVRDTLASTKDAEEFLALLDRIKAAGEPPALVIVDTLASLVLGADENAAGDMTIVMSLLARIAREFDAAVLAIHHVSKGSANGRPGDPNAVRGSSALGGSARSVLTMNGDETNPMFVRLDVAKSNYSRTGLAGWFQREIVNLPAKDPRAPGALAIEEVAILRPHPHGPVPPPPPVAEADILDFIRQGIGGRPFSPSRKSPDRSIKAALEDRFGLSRTDADRRVRDMLARNLLQEKEVYDPVSRKMREAVVVAQDVSPPAPANRPEAATNEG